MPRQAATDNPHGTFKRYSGGKCRCDACKAANTEYHRKYREAKRALAEGQARAWAKGVVNG